MNQFDTGEFKIKTDFGDAEEIEKNFGKVEKSSFFKENIEDNIINSNFKNVNF